MSTFTASEFRSTPNAIHAGVVATGGALTLSVTATASSVIKLCRVPHGATILDWTLFCQTGGAAQIVQLGTSASPSGIAAAFSLSISLTGSANLDAGAILGASYRPRGTDDLMPVRISLSDDAQPREVWIELKAQVAISASAIFVFYCTYTMDGMRGHTTIR